MGPGSSRALQAEPLRPASVLLADPAWHRFVPRAEATARRAAHAAGCTATILLADDRTVRRLNARDRGQDKPTNVLTYDPPAPGLPGQIVLALGVLRREAAAAHRRPNHHLAHLVVHAALHLAGLDHQQAGAAREMEMAEARILGRIGVPNPWKQGQGALPPGPPPRARPWNPSVGSVRVGGVGERVGGRGGAAQPGGT
ncbi:MAG TPA: rRNA maturation RNase YbeY, partial [Acetobacteraceae bacterium]|nr:rRNA maturation RNase YbeY [Acetobacteraceae bacterium]